MAIAISIKRRRKSTFISIKESNIPKNFFGPQATMTTAFTIEMKPTVIGIHGRAQRGAATRSRMAHTALIAPPIYALMPFLQNRIHPFAILMLIKHNPHTLIIETASNLTNRSIALPLSIPEHSA